MHRSRKLINVSTGFRVVDCFFPIAGGQRELIIGDRQTGKSSISIASMINQVSRNSEVFARKSMFCVYVCVGQKCSNTMRTFDLIVKNACMTFLTLIFSTVTDSMSSQFVSPMAGTCVSELIRNNGNHCLVVYDDLSKHAVAYRQLSLFLRKPAGREAYPSDVFFLHARLLERSCCLNYVVGAGTQTCLPIIETLGNDLSAYVATNVVSITDGQLYLDSVLFGVGTCPAVSVERSVSRVGAKSLDVL